MPSSAASTQAAVPASPFEPLDTFARRHLGSDSAEQTQTLAAIGQPSLEALIATAVPATIRLPGPLDLPPGIGENAMLTELRSIAAHNQVFRSFIGQGYHDTITPPVVQRNILENPGWYTQYTPYQAEIAQGRLEALLNFQTLITDLTALPIANASLLDEGTAAAEALTLALAARSGPDRRTFFISEDCHPQTIAVVLQRAEPLGITTRIGPWQSLQPDPSIFGALLQYPATDGSIYDYAPLIARLHEAGALAIVAADLLALTLLRPPGEFGADVAVGSAQRLGVPLGYGGPHAGFFATRDEFKRQMPGRLVGVSRDAEGRPALRLSLQTREQHIRRDKATSNICTAQVLLAVMASMYAIYHGPEGLRAIARRIRLLTLTLARTLRELGYTVNEAPVFDTLTIHHPTVSAVSIHAAATARRINLRPIDDHTVCLSFDEPTTLAEWSALASLFAEAAGRTGLEAVAPASLAAAIEPALPPPHARTSPFLTHAVFQRYHTETEFLRYVRRLESRDLSLCTSMIPLGSCTMKLNATAEMLAVTWPEFSRLHPFAPRSQAAGYARIFADLERWLAEITGLPCVSLQPNAGSAGEYAGLLAIRAWHRSRGEHRRQVCLIPVSAHGTNPASAVMAGMKVVAIACDTQGNIDVADLRAKAAAHTAELAALMVTYPSTHGVFEDTIREICEIVHAHGGQVYMDGANMNAQVGLTSPGRIGADVCHLNLHKTFCIPHGGGGPGVGPIAVASHLAPFMPGHPVVPPGPSERASLGPVAAAPWGSASILLISWAYIRMMGGGGLTLATKIAILNANYMAHKLAPHFPILYRGRSGCVAHEFILDCRSWKQRAGIEVEDIAKRLMDYGFHAPTISWPVPGTIMVEPTESESPAELDRLCDALIGIAKEMAAIESGAFDRTNNPLKNAPHTAEAVVSDAWSRPYPRQTAAFPASWSRTHKFWPAVARIDNVHGDRNLICSCVGMEAHS